MELRNSSVICSNFFMDLIRGGLRRLLKSTVKFFGYIKL